jgi:hypothetical protein
MSAAFDQLYHDVSEPLGSYIDHKPLDAARFDLVNHFAWPLDAPVPRVLLYVPGAIQVE